MPHSYNNVLVGNFELIALHGPSAPCVNLSTVDNGMSRCIGIDFTARARVQYRHVSEPVLPAYCISQARSSQKIPVRPSDRDIGLMLQILWCIPTIYMYM